MKPLLHPTLLTYICLAFVFSAHAKNTPAPDKIDHTRAQMLYLKGDPVRGIAAWVACHGPSGNSEIAQNPNLAQQHKAYIIKQLRAQAKLMAVCSKSLTDNEIRELATYLSIQPAKSVGAQDIGTPNLGKTIYRASIAERHIPACAGCHGPNGSGLPNQFPRIAGQHTEYIVARLNYFSSAAQKTETMIFTIADRMLQKEIKAVANYIASLK